MNEIQTVSTKKLTIHVEDKYNKNNIIRENELRAKGNEGNSVIYVQEASVIPIHFEWITAKLYHMSNLLNNIYSNWKGGSKKQSN